MKWRRGTFEINLTKEARADGASSTRTGWVSDPFAVYMDDKLKEVSLTHIPAGAKIPCAERTIAGAKAFAARLLAAAGSHDWNGPKGASPKKTVPTRRSAWFRKAEEIFIAVYDGADEPPSALIGTRCVGPEPHLPERNAPTAKRGGELKD